ncbi:MAG: SDR family NAD(P)-dependent oxidoreductase [Pseudomonadota bacterium]
MDRGISTGVVMGSLRDGYRAAVIGATGAIGGAVANHLAADPRCAEVRRFGRRPLAGETPLDVTDEASIAAAAEDVGEIHLLVIATGGLIVGEHRPEKALSQLNAEALQAQFALNAVGPALALKHFHRSLPRGERSLVGALSARVGSIGDNGLGGWYGYRAAKAALNQYMRAASIEIARSRKQAVIAALHPGTVESDLSKPFRPAGAGDPGIFTPAQSAEALLHVLDGLSAEQSGGFWAYDGSAIPW